MECKLWRNILQRKPKFRNLWNHQEYSQGDIKDRRSRFMWHLAIERTEKKCDMDKKRKDEICSRLFHLDGLL
jgi:hypothetical protein